jgi:hypothetical protein
MGGKRLWGKEADLGPPSYSIPDPADHLHQLQFELRPWDLPPRVVNLTVGLTPLPHTVVMGGREPRAGAAIREGIMGGRWRPASCKDSGRGCFRQVFRCRLLDSTIFLGWKSTPGHLENVHGQ